MAAAQRTARAAGLAPATVRRTDADEGQERDAGEKVAAGREAEAEAARRNSIGDEMGGKGSRWEMGRGESEEGLRGGARRVPP